MIHEIPNDSELLRLRAPSLVAWLVSNTERLVLVAGALDERAEELSPGVPGERIVDLCKTIRHSALEITVSLLALLSRSEGSVNEGVLAEAIANAHVRIQQLTEAEGGS